MWLLTGALYVHEIRIGRLHDALQLVLLLFRFDGWVEQIDGESLFNFHKIHEKRSGVGERGGALVASVADDSSIRMTLTIFYGF